MSTRKGNIVNRSANQIRTWWILRRLRNERLAASSGCVESLSRCGVSAVSQLVTAVTSYHPHELSDSLKPKVAGTYDVSVDYDKCRSYLTLRRCAAAALGNIGNVEAFEALKDLLYSESRRQQCCSLARNDLFALAGLHHSESADILETAAVAISGLEDNDPELHRDYRITASAVLIGALGLTAFKDGVYGDTDRKQIRDALCKALKILGQDKWGALREWEDVYRVDDPLAYVPLRIALQEIDYLSPSVEWGKKERWARTIGDIAERLETIGNPIAIDALEKARARLSQLPNELSDRVEVDARSTRSFAGTLARIMQKTNTDKPGDTYEVDSAVRSVEKAIDVLTHLAT